MTDYSLVPVDHQPDFGNYSLVPVDHNPFAGEGAQQPAPAQVAQVQNLSLQPSTGASVAQSNVGTPGVGSQSPLVQTQSAPAGNSPEDEAAMSPETYVNPFVKRVLGNLVTSAVTLPQRAIDAARVSFEQNYGSSPLTMSDPDVRVDPLPGVAAETALMTAGGVGAPRVAGLATKGVARTAEEASGGSLAAERGAADAHGGMPPPDSATSVRYKLDNYLLDPDHVSGGSKAEWFRQALGFTRENSADLAKQLVFDESQAVRRGVSEYGTVFNQTINVTGANGRTIPVTTGWTIGPDGVPRLNTAFPAR